MLPCGREHILTFIFSRFLGERFFIVFGTVLAPLFGTISIPWRSLGAALGSCWIPLPSLCLPWVALGWSLVRFCLFAKMVLPSRRELDFHGLGYCFGTLEVAICIPGGSLGTLNRSCWVPLALFLPPWASLGKLLGSFVRLRKWCFRQGERSIFIVLDITLDTLLGAFGITLGSFGCSWGVLGVLVDPVGTVLAPFGCSWHLLWLLLALRGPFF